jgi:hypothetical protein
MVKITLKEFLKKITSIPKKFINEYYEYYEYYEFYDISQIYYFGIPTDKVMKYLGIKS